MLTSFCFVLFLFISKLALEESIHIFEEAKAGVTTKIYDYLDQRNMEFDADFDIFLEKTDKLKESIGTLIEENFANVWETPQGIHFLTRFEKVGELNADNQVLN